MKNITLFLLTISLISGTQAFCMHRVLPRTLGLQDRYVTIHDLQPSIAKRWRGDSLALATSNLDYAEQVMINVRHAISMIEINLKAERSFLMKALFFARYTWLRTLLRISDSELFNDPEKIKAFENRLEKVNQHLGALQTYRENEYSPLASIFKPEKEEQYDIVLDALYWHDVQKNKFLHMSFKEKLKAYTAN